MNRYYTPETKTEKPLSIDRSIEQEEHLKRETIKVSMEDDVILQRLARDIYKKPESGLRELYVNEAKACRIARDRYGLDPEIHVTIDDNMHRLIIEGINSTGIDVWTFENVYTVLGRTTNNDGKENGQFGMGRFAYMCLSDTMMLETRSVKTGEHFKVMGRGGMVFDTGLPVDGMEHTGTRIKMTIREDISSYELEDMLRKCAVLSGVRTILHMDGKSENLPVFSKLKSLHDKKRGHWILENDDFEIDVTDGYTSRGINQSCFLARVPIGYRHNRIGLNVTVNIKDEKKFKPTPDRERLTENAEKAVEEGVNAMIDDLIKKSTPFKSLEAYVMSDMHGIFSNIPNDEIPDEQTKRYEWFGEQVVKKHDGMWTKIGSQVTLRTKRSYSREQADRIRLPLIADKLIQRKIDAVLESHDVIIFTTPGLDGDKFIEAGIQTLDGFMKEHGIIPEKLSRRRSNRQATVHDINENGWDYMEKKEYDEIDDDTLVTDSCKEWVDLIKRGKFAHKVVKWNKNITSGITE